MSEHTDGDIISTSAAENISARLGLKYEYVMNGTRALRIMIGTIALLSGIMLLQKIQTQFDLFGALFALGIFVRLSMGSPMIRQLTPESRAKLQEWLRSEEYPTQESSHVNTDE